MDGGLAPEWEPARRLQNESVPLGTPLNESDQTETWLS